MFAKKKKIIFHIGSHKTGTTTLQHWLHENRSLLAQHDMDYVTVGPSPHVHDVIGFVDPEHFVPRGAHIVHPLILRTQLKAAQHDTVVVSSENFSFFFEQNSVEALRDLVKDLFKEVQIVVYLRRQDSHAVSHYQEGAKPLRDAEEQLFGYELSALPAPSDHLRLYLDYEKRIGLWLNAFGDDNVTVRKFERKDLVGEDIVTDFLDTLGVSIDRIPPVENKNISMGFSGVTVGHMMNERSLPTPLKRQILNAIPNDEKMLPSLYQAREFYDEYRAGNIRLNERLGSDAGTDLFSNSFSFYPQEEQGQWTHEKSHEIISVLLDHLQKHPIPLQIDAIRDAAIQAHNTGKGARALALIECAAALRPTGEFIQKLLREYKELYG